MSGVTGIYGLLFGIILNGFFTGVLNVQVYLYFRNFSRDYSGFKIMVAVLWVIQMLFLPISAFGVYFQLISCQKDPVMLVEVKWETRYPSTQMLLVTMIAHVFFASRLWSCIPILWRRIPRYSSDKSVAVGKDLRVMIPLGVLVAATSAFGLSVNYRWYTDQFSPTESTSLGHWSITVWKSLIVATDSTISIYLSHLMMRKRSAIHSTNSIMKLVMLYGVATGTVSTILALAIVLAYKQAWYGGVALFSICGPPINICAVLSNLHMRSGLRAREARHVTIPVSLSTPGLSQLFRSRGQQIPPITVTPPPATAGSPDIDCVRGGNANARSTPVSSAWRLNKTQQIPLQKDPIIEVCANSLHGYQARTDVWHQ
ncbi:hypothetical protein DL93DRAFT_1301105 [Clavulina sp. PMI_390]|nr:hypothetical protein DL93DRAFT_1301105 [Clavulina sp. PMI_390]